MARRRTKSFSARRKSGAGAAAVAANGVAARPRANTLTHVRDQKAVGKMTKRNIRKLGLVPDSVLNSVNSSILTTDGANRSYQSFFMRNDLGPVMVVNPVARANDQMMVEIRTDLKQMTDTQPELFPDGQKFPATIVVQTDGSSTDVALVRGMVQRLVADNAVNDPDAAALAITAVDQSSDGEVNTLTFRVGPIADADRRQAAPANGNALAAGSGDPRQRRGIPGLIARIRHARQRVRDKRLAVPLTKLNTGTASDVFSTATAGSIGKTGTAIGYAKIALKAGDISNDTTINLDMAQEQNGSQYDKLTVDPNLIARQVQSHRLDRALGIEVVAAEVFTSDDQGRVVGVTAKANGIPMMDKTANADVYNFIDLANPTTQKGLSDLQLMDALTGQMDRHMGNIFVDPNTGQVTGIDNDMAFPISSAVDRSGNTLSDQFSNANGTLVYNQTQIDAGTAEKVLAMSEDQFRALLQGRKSDPEKLEPDAINNAVLRFRAVKAQIEKLKAEGKLVRSWNDDTFFQAMRDGFRNDNPDDMVFFQKNYVARAVVKYDEAGNPDNPNIQVRPDLG